MSSTALSYTLVITGAPWASQAPQTALEFARALLAAGHRLDRVFLYGDGIHLASALATPPSDEPNWPRQWAEFLAAHQVPAVACIASTLRRGLVNETEQARYELPASNLLAPFEIAGLGEWVEGRLKTDRTVYFHGSGA
ncbi:tRNA 2-thiouridine synthesizing protein D [Marinobacter persicus]|uniref:tRNA 2-thiouridine synthesizing protein D n=1 Tax=Marinobacter persicus TaxID=930118 RepID=A0A1I3TXT5_9GAMM|nr:sulfurtransferase complex subunit TusD [Marinobacter persicus]GHD45516.1 sulfurtransferase TusD [Marinobacter persicus]SFJ76054.1 tRNA 2-thiouridine synthesizing protein D [Marinobacter persicus]